MTAPEGAQDGGAGGSRLATLAESVTRAFGDAASPLDCRPGELAYALPADRLLELAKTLRDDPALRFESCIDVCGVDFLEYGRAEWKTGDATATGFSRGVARAEACPEHAPAQIGRRFAVVYQLLSISLNQRLRVRVYCPDDAQPMVDSVTGIWASANWFEREAFDLFGILFRGHPDLRRILTDYGFIGHPFRKDFPLIGNVEVRYDPEKGRIVYEPVSIEPRILVPRVIRHDNRYDPQLTNATTNG
jgi:NADH-quinone oxidoreductase subunit C